MSTPIAKLPHRYSPWPIWFWLLLVSAPVVFIGCMHYLENRTDSRQAWHVTELEYLPSNSSTPPLQPLASDQAFPQRSWQNVRVPHRVLGNWKTPQEGWLRIAIPPSNSETQNWMLVIPTPNNASYSLWLSGVRFITAGSHDSGVSSMPSNPIIMEFPLLALQDGERQIYLRVTNELGGINPNDIYLGPAELLQSYSNHVTFIKKTLIRVILVMMAIMVIVVFFLHLVRKKQTSIYGWYALGVSVWLLHTLHAQHENPAFGSVWFWYRTTYITLAAYVLSALVFINRLIDRPQPRLELALFVLFLVGSTFILVNPTGIDGILRFNTLLWIPATIVGGLYMLVRLALGARRAPDPQTLLLLAATFFGVCVGIRDYLYNDLQLIPGGMLYLRHAAGLILVAFSFVMIRRFASNVQKVRHGSPSSATTTTANANPANDMPDAPLRAGASNQPDLLQQEHDDLERQLQQAVLNVESNEGTAQFNNNMRAARHDLQLIRDMIDRGEDAPTGEVLANMQTRLSRSARRQRVPLSWEHPLVTDERFILNHYELALARFIQTATLEALAFESVTEVLVQAQPSHSGEIMTITVQADLETQPSPLNPPTEVFSKRAQLEAAARVLRGKLHFTNVSPTEEGQGTRCRVELEWQSLPVTDSEF